MNVYKTKYSLKKHFLNFFAKNIHMVIGNMYFRLYDPVKDVIVKNYNDEDWRKILSNITEDDFKDLFTCSNVVILIWCDLATDTPHGMLYFEENYNCPFEVLFHGGTWDHNPKYYREIFRSIVHVFDFMLNFKTIISTTCGIDNARADKFQNSLCFEEIKRDELVKYKVLNKQNFSESSFVNKLRLVTRKED